MMHNDFSVQFDFNYTTNSYKLFNGFLKNLEVLINKNEKKIYVY